MDAERKTRPVIGVSTSVHGGLISWWFNRFCIWRAGGRAVRLTASLRTAWEKLDGLVIGGGDDISAHHYGGELDFDVRIDHRRDELELKLLEHAHRHFLPVLGICRGAQMINIFLGGSLHTDIYEVAAALPRMRTVLPKKWVRLEKGSRLQSIMGGHHYRVNCLHHQSIDRTGDNLEPVAWDFHGLVQGIEKKDTPHWIGVQWHPEFLLLHPAQGRLYKQLVHAAGKPDTKSEVHFEPEGEPQVSPFHA